jgi:formate dehydrogenase subunit delta
MDIQHLVKMANNIASFFEAEPDASKGAKGVAEHLKNFWDPRMRREILRYANEQGGTGLKALVLEALRIHGELIAPKPEASQPLVMSVEESRRESLSSEHKK